MDRLTKITRRKREATAKLRFDLGQHFFRQEFRIEFDLRRHAKETRLIRFDDERHDGVARVFDRRQQAEKELAVSRNSSAFSACDCQKHALLFADLNRCCQRLLETAESTREVLVVLK